MPPSGIIDTSLAPWDENVYFAIDSSGIWKTSNLFAGGAATWEQVYLVSSFTLGTDLRLMRIIATVTENLVYVLGYGKKEGQSTYTAFFFRSANGGTVWWEGEIAETDAVLDAFSLSAGDAFSADHASYDASGVLHSEVAGGIALSGHRTSVILPTPAISTGSFTVTGGAGWVSCKIRVTGNPMYGPGDAEGAARPVLKFDGFENYNYGVEIEPGIYEYTPEEPPSQDEVLEFIFYRDHSGIGTICIDQSYYYDFEVIEWNNEKCCVPAAMDYALSNVSWIYVGLEEKIMKSEDGGYHWSILTEDHGAYDIKVDPQAAGAIYYWSSLGDLKLMVAGTVQASLLTETTPLKRHLRLARQLNGGKLWALAATGTGMELKMRDVGSWTTQVMAIAGGRGLRAYLGSPAKLVYVDSSKIWYSTNGGTTWEDKTGDWGGFSGGMTIHLVT